MLSSLPNLQKERGFPHPSRKKKLLKFKRESTPLGRHLNFRNEIRELLKLPAQINLALTLPGGHCVS
jgi:hypothetical protein